LGECERAIAKSFKRTKESFLRPVPALSERWLREADDGSPEFRLAASLASVYGYYSDHDGKPTVMPIRAHMEPVHTCLIDGHLGVAFDEDQSRDLVWSEGDPLSAMNRIMARRIMRAVQSGSRLYPDRGWLNADLGDIADFIDGRIDLRHMMDLLRGMILVDWPSVSKDAITKRQMSDLISPVASYSLLKLCFAGENVRRVEIPIVPEIQRRAASGDSSTAIRLAEHRLRGSGLPTTTKGVTISPRLMERTAAALLFPIAGDQIDALANKVLRPDRENSEINMII
jgi:CRISPR-associated protein Csx17